MTAGAVGVGFCKILPHGAKSPLRVVPCRRARDRAERRRDFRDRAEAQLAAPEAIAPATALALATALTLG